MTGLGGDDHPFCLGLATLVMAEHLASAEPDEPRRHRKQAAAQRKWTALREGFAADLDELHGYGGTGPALRQLVQALAHAAHGLAPARRRLLLVDLVMSDAFAPYELKVTTNDFAEALRQVAAALDLSGAVDDLLDAWSGMLRAHGPRRWRTVIGPSVLSASTLATSGPDPAVATALATAAALSGEAATAHGVALLGGGSLSVGGGHLAGGTWLVTTGPDDDAVLPGGGRGLLALGPAQARVELIKLLLSTDFVVRDGLLPDIDVGEVSGALAAISSDLDTQLEVELRVNDDDASRLMDIRTMMSVIQTTRRQVDVDDAAA